MGRSVRWEWALIRARGRREGQKVLERREGASKKHHHSVWHFEYLSLCVEASPSSWSLSLPYTPVRHRLRAWHKTPERQGGALGAVLPSPSPRRLRSNAAFFSTRRKHSLSCPQNPPHAPLLNTGGLYDDARTPAVALRTWWRDSLGLAGTRRFALARICQNHEQEQQARGSASGLEEKTAMLGGHARDERRRRHDCLAPTTPSL